MFKLYLNAISTLFVYSWYITSGRTDKAIEMLKKFEKVNRKTVAPEVYEEFEKSCNFLMQDIKKGTQYTVFDLFKLKRQRRITIMLVLYW